MVALLLVVQLHICRVNVVVIYSHSFFQTHLRNLHIRLEIMTSVDMLVR